MPGFDDLVIQSGKEGESNIEESKPDTESQFRGDSRNFKKITRRFFADRHQEADRLRFFSFSGRPRAGGAVVGLVFEPLRPGHNALERKILKVLTHSMAHRRRNPISPPRFPLTLGSHRNRLQRDTK